MRARYIPTMLPERVLEGRDSMFRAIESVGGLYVVWPDTDGDTVRDAVTDGGVRALEVQLDPLDFMNGLPLEFLMLTLPRPRIDPVNGLGRLRGLTATSWEGALEVGRLPDLEWLGVAEAEPGDLDGLWAEGHDRLHHLAVGKYREANPGPLESMRALTHVRIGDSHRLNTLEGIGQLPSLRHLEVFSCRKLDSLVGIEAATALQHVEISSCRGITDLSPLAALPDLRSVQLEMLVPPSLEPLIGHPALEYVWLVGGKRPAQDEIARLRHNHALRFMALSRSVWLRDEDWEYIGDIYAMSAEQLARHDRMIHERDVVAMW